MDTRLSKNKRIDLRLSSEFKGRIAQAASIYGVSVSTFISTSALERADRVLAERETLLLNDAMRNQFLESLDRPARPMPESVRKSMQRYDEEVRVPGV